MMNVGLVGVASIVGTIVAILAHHGGPSPLESRRALAITIRTCGAILWPTVLLAMVPASDRNNPVLVIPLVFQWSMWLLDSLLLNTAPSRDPETPASLRFETAGLTGLSIGIASLLGNKPTSEHAHLFLYAILGCLVVVLPSHNLKPGCIHDQVFESVQKTAFSWCLGLLIAAASLTRYRTCTSPSCA